MPTQADLLSHAIPPLVTPVRMEISRGYSHQIVAVETKPVGPFEIKSKNILKNFHELEDTISFVVHKELHEIETRNILHMYLHMRTDEIRLRKKMYQTSNVHFIYHILI